MSKILVVANETLLGREVVDAVRKRAQEEPGTEFVLCVPQNRPQAGLVVYDDAVFDSRPLFGDDGRGPRAQPERDHHLHLPGDPFRVAAA
jgi:hypothetical protein